jgi:hypothetical protein
MLARFRRPQTFEKRLERGQIAIYVAALTNWASCGLVIPDVGTSLESAIYPVLGVLPTRQRANAVASPRPDDAAPYASCHTNVRFQVESAGTVPCLSSTAIWVRTSPRVCVSLLCTLAIRPVEGVRWSDLPIEAPLNYEPE